MNGIDAAVPGFIWQLLFFLGLLAIPAAVLHTAWQAGIGPRVLAVACSIGLALSVGSVMFAPQIEMIAGWLR